MTDEDREKSSPEELPTVVFKFIGGGYMLGAIVLYVYQLSRLTSLFFRDLSHFPEISD